MMRGIVIEMNAGIPSSFGDFVIDFHERVGKPDKGEVIGASGEDKYFFRKLDGLGPVDRGVIKVENNPGNKNAESMSADHP